MGDEEHRITVHLGKLAKDRGLTLTQIAEKIGRTPANVSVLNNGHANAVRFSTLTRLCQVLECQPGDLLVYEPPEG